MTGEIVGESSAARRCSTDRWVLADQAECSLLADQVECTDRRTGCGWDGIW